MKVLVTGSEGFIGRHLTRYLKQKKYDVLTLDVKGSADVKCDVTDHDSFSDVVKTFKPDWAVHLAAYMGELPYEHFRVNAYGAAVVADVCSWFGVKLLFMSSGAIFGRNPAGVPVKECEVIPFPENPYALSKMVAEDVIEYYKRKHNLEACVLRSWDVVGEGVERSRGTIIARFVEKIRKGEDVSLYCYGDQIFDVNYVGNLCHAIELCISQPEKSIGEVFHVGSGEAHSLYWMVKVMKRHARSRSKIMLLHPREGEQPIVSYPDITKIRQLLGYQPQVDVEEALRRTIKGEQQP